jgi:hypothetical protein
MIIGVNVVIIHFEFELDLGICFQTVCNFIQNKFMAFYYFVKNHICFTAGTMFLLIYSDFPTSSKVK